MTVSGLTPPAGADLRALVQVFSCRWLIPETDEQVLQHFLSNSNWDERGVLDQVALGADELLGGSKETALLIDESGIAKKGKKSVGVARQWNGRLGKVDNCQVGVYAALSRGRLSTLIDTRLYLPSSWIEDKARCEAVQVPPKARRSKSNRSWHWKWCVTIEAWVCVFAGWVRTGCMLYGNDPAFLRALEDDGETFMVDVHKDQRIYLEDPQPAIPANASGKGRKCTKPVAQCAPVRVDRWLKAQPEAAWTR